MRRKRKRKPNDYRHNDDGTTTIFLGGKTYPGKETLVDTKYWPEVSQLTWGVKCETRGRDIFYAKANRYIGDDRTSVELHRFIKELEGEVTLGDGTHVRHLDDDGLNNISENIKVGTPGANLLARPRPSHRGGKPIKNPYMGVYLQSSGLYRAVKKWNGKNIYLGTYADAVEAAIVWDKKTVELLDGHIESPKNQLNFPERLEEYLAEINK
jgi:hypothetical protein